MKITDIIKIWRMISRSHEISVTQDEKVHFYDKDRKELFEVELSVFEKFQKNKGEKNVI